jgi:hypothetical protein
MSGDPEEVRTTLPMDVSLVDQLKVGIVNESSRLQDVARAFAAELMVSQTTELSVDGVDDLVSSLVIARTPLDEQPRNA